MIERFSLAVVLFSFAVPAGAAECEQGFTKKGNPVTGLTFVATTSVADMTVASGIGQLRGIALGKGYDVLAAEPETGTMLIEQPATGKARSFPLTIAVTPDGSAGRARMEARLRATMNVPAAAAQAEMCGMLNRLRGGKAGLALARQGMDAQASRNAAPLRMSVLAFSSQMGGEARRNSEAMIARHKGKSFTIWGTVGDVIRAGDSYRVDFKLLESVLTGILPGSGYRVEVGCTLASGHAAFALGLKPDKRVELTGVFDEYDLGRVILRDCRPRT